MLSGMTNHSLLLPFTQQTIWGFAVRPTTFDDLALAFNNLWSRSLLGFALCLWVFAFLFASSIRTNVPIWVGFILLYINIRLPQASCAVSIYACPHRSIAAFSPPYPHPCFHLMYPIITALLLSREVWGCLSRVATRDPYQKRWHTFKPRGYVTA